MRFKVYRCFSKAVGIVSFGEQSFFILKQGLSHIDSTYALMAFSNGEI
ncbi:MAG TPA: hypothetical protein VER14_07450 [Phototrophicaceae bacterium]|nr:hypothetical protein [Phototrophicaceae bacterium]